MTLASFVSSIRKEHGAGAIVSSKDRPPCEVISTGSLNIDIATGIGGIPRGRITEIYGPESGGKTTLALQTCGRAQKNGPVLYADMEHALDLNYAVNLGLDVSEENFTIAQPDTAEECLSIVLSGLKSNVFSAVVIDSIASLCPKAELEGEIGDAYMAVMARLMSQAMRKMVKAVAVSNIPFICINQIRSTMGGMPGMGPTNTTSAGRALKFYSSLRLEVTRTGTNKDSDGIPNSNRTKVKVAKNKLAPPFREVESDLVFGEGFSLVSDILDIGVLPSVKLFEKSGAWYTINGERCQGKKQAVEYLTDNPEFADECEAKIRTLYGIK